MGKRKEGPVSSEEDAEDSSSHSPHKKHKKHKKKHKKKKTEDDMTVPVTYSASPCSEGKSTIKLKIKIGGEPLGTKSVTPCSDEVVLKTPPKAAKVLNLSGTAPEEEGEVDVDTDSQLDPTKKKKDDSDEEKWLDALEKGELDDYGELKKMKDPSLLTTRQKALLHGKQDSDLLQLPSGYKVTELTEEQIQRRQQRAKKRRIQAHEKREKDKKLTLDRLLKKQATKGKGSKNKSRRANIPRFCYRNTTDLITVSIPTGYTVPILSQPAQAKLPPAPVRCGVPGCHNQKKYSCSKTAIPLCSLQCYKTNLKGVNRRGHATGSKVTAAR